MGLDLLDSNRLNPIWPLWDVVEPVFYIQDLQLTNLQQLCDVRMDQNLRGIFLTTN